MPVPEYEGDTFIGFLDMSGFKELMKAPGEAARALDRFYQIGYDILLRQQGQNGQPVHGFFLSDCAILFVSQGYGKTWTRLAALLAVVESINRRLVDHEIMTTTSVAYGHFSYHGRIEFPGIEKNPLFGNAYVDAYLDNATGAPRVQPGECRVLRDSVPDIEPAEPEAASAAVRMRASGKHSYFFWMVESEGQIEAFEANYRDSYKRKYAGMLDALHKASGRA
jgi:hypothetical protein